MDAAFASDAIVIWSPNFQFCPVFFPVIPGILLLRLVRTRLHRQPANMKRYGMELRPAGRRAATEPASD